MCSLTIECVLLGLASSNEDDAHHYFQNLNSHLVPIVFKDDADDEIVDKWFRKNRADDRKVCLYASSLTIECVLLL